MSFRGDVSLSSDTAAPPAIAGPCVAGQGEQPVLLGLSFPKPARGWRSSRGSSTGLKRPQLAPDQRLPNDGATAGSSAMVCPCVPRWGGLGTHRGILRCWLQKPDAVIWAPAWRNWGSSIYCWSQLVSKFLPINASPLASQGHTCEGERVAPGPQARLPWAWGLYWGAGPGTWGLFWGALCCGIHTLPSLQPAGRAWPPGSGSGMGACGALSDCRTLSCTLAILLGDEGAV